MKRALTQGNRFGWQGALVLPVEYFGEQSVGGLLKYWEGAIWVAKPLKHWSGAVWQTGSLKFWNSTEWQLSNSDG